MAERIGILPRTRLHSVWRVHVNSQGCMGWHAYTSADNSASYPLMGVGLLMCDNGVAFRTSYQPDHDREEQCFP